jgi:hypothetical protein
LPFSEFVLFQPAGFEFCIILNLKFEILEGCLLKFHLVEGSQLFIYISLLEGHLFCLLSNKFVAERSIVDAQKIVLSKSDCFPLSLSQNLQLLVP